MRAFVLAALVSMAAGIAAAKTVTLTATQTDPRAQFVYVEQPFGRYTITSPAARLQQGGFTFDTSTSYTNSPMGLTDDGGLVSSTLRRTDGKTFSLFSADIAAYKYNAFRTGTGKRPDQGSPEFDAWLFGTNTEAFTWSIVGYLGDTVVGSLSRPLGDFLTDYYAANLMFDATFAKIDRLVFSMNMPKNFQFMDYALDSEDAARNTYWCADNYCGQAELSNIVVGAVPLPASAVLLASGLVAAGAVRRLRRRAA